MKKSILVRSANLANKRLNLLTNESISGLIPREHMLVDSEHFSFIYLMENSNDYTYIVIHEAIWSTVMDAMIEELPVFLMDNEEKIELLHFQSELNYLINNIKGNSNYGEKLVQKVEDLFLR